MKKLLKSVRPDRQYPRVTATPEVDLDFRGHPNRTAVLNYEKQIPRHRQRKE